MLKKCSLKIEPKTDLAAGVGVFSQIWTYLPTLFLDHLTFCCFYLYLVLWGLPGTLKVSTYLPQYFITYFLWNTRTSVLSLKLISCKYSYFVLSAFCPFVQYSILNTLWKALINPKYSILLSKLLNTRQLYLTYTNVKLLKAS